MKLKPKKQRLDALSIAEQEESYQLIARMMADKIILFIKNNL